MTVTRDSDCNQESDVSLESSAINTVTVKSSNTEDKLKSKTEDYEHSGNTNKSYKVLEFEKVIKMPVIDIEMLRKLAWNGIPVSNRSSRIFVTKKRF